MSRELYERVARLEAEVFKSEDAPEEELTWTDAAGNSIGVEGLAAMDYRAVVEIVEHEQTTATDARRIGELEAAGKDRKTVREAVAAKVGE